MYFIRTELSVAQGLRWAAGQPVFLEDAFPQPVKALDGARHGNNPRILSLKCVTADSAASEARLKTASCIRGMRGMKSVNVFVTF